MSKKKKGKKKNEKKSFNGNIILTIQQTHALYEQKIEATFSKYDLSNEQYRILQILNEAPENGYSLRQIREMLPNQTSNATRLVDKLKSKKLLSKKSARTDKRELRIRITEDGLLAYKNVGGAIGEIQEQISKNIGSKTGKSAVAVLNSIAEVLSHEENSIVPQ